MATTNDQLAERIEGLRGLLAQIHEQRSAQLSAISTELKVMNGRQRDNTADISANREAIGTLRTRIDLAVDAARQDTNRKATAVGILSFIQALGSFLAGVLTRQ